MLGFARSLAYGGVFFTISRSVSHLSRENSSEIFGALALANVMYHAAFQQQPFSL